MYNLKLLLFLMLLLAITKPPVTADIQQYRLNLMKYYVIFITILLYDSIFSIV